MQATSALEPCMLQATRSVSLSPTRTEPEARIGRKQMCPISCANSYSAHWVV